MYKKGLFISAFVFVLVSCANDTVFSSFKSTSDGAWEAEDPKEFSISDLDTIQHYNLFINVRNDNTYPFSNLFLIAQIDFPDGNTVRDTLEYEMAKPDGEWLGTGRGSIKENKLWYKENIVFSDSGVYKITLSHAMRKNGSVEGLSQLEGITDVGIQIEKRE